MNPPVLTHHGPDPDCLVVGLFGTPIFIAVLYIFVSNTAF